MVIELLSLEWELRVFFRLRDVGFSKKVVGWLMNFDRVWVLVGYLIL